METNFLFVSNLPRSFNPVLLLHDVSNKWARMVYFDSQYFSTTRDCFIFTPGQDKVSMKSAVQKLRTKEFDTGDMKLDVSYIWFPPDNVEFVTHVPEGVVLLPHLFIDGLPKALDPVNIIRDLPQENLDYRFWDVKEKEDKWLIVRLPQGATPALRQFSLRLLRQRLAFVVGRAGRVREMLASSEPTLSSTFTPTVATIRTPSYRSNFFYIYNMPRLLTTKQILEVGKEDSIKGVKVFFLNTVNNIKSGFLYVPKSLPEPRLAALIAKLRSTEFKVDGQTELAKMAIEEVWFQPGDGDPPTVPEKSFVLTQFLFLYQVPANAIPANLTDNAPISFHVQLFQVADFDGQIGFVFLQNLSPTEVQLLITYLRELSWGPHSILVDEIWIGPRGAAEEDNPDRPALPVGRQCLRALGSGAHSAELMSALANITLIEIPHGSCNLVKTDFLHVGRLPAATSRGLLLWDVGTTVHGFCVSSADTPDAASQTRCAFVYLAKCPLGLWAQAIDRISTKSFTGLKFEVKEVYLQTDDDLIGVPPQGVHRSQFLFVYNVSAATTDVEVAIGVPHLLQLLSLVTDGGDRCAFAQLDSSDQTAVEDALRVLRAKRLCGRPVFADVVWLAEVKMKQSSPLPPFGLSDMEADEDEILRQCDLNPESVRRRYLNRDNGEPLAKRPRP